MKLLPSSEISLPYELEIHYKRPLFDQMYYVHEVYKAVTLIRKIIPVQQLSFKEFFVVILLSNANRVIGSSIISVGCTNGTLINIKEIFQLALLSNATGIILGHNHPSGKLAISDSDKRQTKKVKRLADLMQVTLLDHIIVTAESYTSFAEQDLL